MTRRRGSLVARTAALLGLGGLAVHQLRYSLWSPPTTKLTRGLIYAGLARRPPPLIAIT